MILDFDDDIVDEDDILNQYSYKEKVEKFGSVMKEAKTNRKKMRTEFKHKGRTYEFVVDKDGTGSLRKKPQTSSWF